MIIVIASQHGAGKTTLMNLLSKRFPQLRVLEMGKKFRELAMKRGMSIEDFSKYLSEHPEESEKIDREMDRWQKEQIEEGDIMINSNLGAMVANNADIKVLLVCPLDVRAKRVFEKQREGDRKATSIEQVKQNLLERDRSDRERYLRLYNFDMFDKKHYDIILNTAEMTPEEEVETIIKEMKRRSSI